VNVYLDGEFAFGLARIVAAWLEVGQEISDEKIAELQSEDSHEVAYQQALKLLNYRARTEAEIRQNLQKHEFSEEHIAQALERLRQNGLLNDERFAQGWVENRSEMRPRSRRALSQELRQRGIDDETIRETLDQIDDEALAYQAALKQARKLNGLEWQDFRQKMYGFLARRGFNYEVSAPVTAQVWAELHDPDQPPSEEVSL
jgi:regulatory protein